MAAADGREVFASWTLEILIPGGALVDLLRPDDLPVHAGAVAGGPRSNNRPTAGSRGPSPGGRGRLKAWRLPIAIALLAVLASLAGTPLEDALRYERERILEGQLHRLVSAHFLHMSGLHLALNLAGLGIAWWLVGRYAKLRAWLLIVAASMLAVGFGLLAFAPELDWYVGLSGMLHGLLLAGALLAGRAGLPLLVLVIIKLGWEQFAGPALTAWPGGPVVVDAHLYGAIGGALAALGLRARPTPA